MLGAYVLAGELATAADHQAAFAAHERTLRGYVEGNHELGRQATESLLVPPTQELIDAIAAGPATARPPMTISRSPTTRR